MSEIDLQKIRENNNLTQKQLAEKLCLTLRTIQNYEKSGDIPPAIRKLIEYEFFSHQVNTQKVKGNYNQSQQGNNNSIVSEGGKSYNNQSDLRAENEQLKKEIEHLKEKNELLNELLQVYKAK